MRGRRPPHLVAAPDKFRGTAGAREIAAAAAGAARRLGWTADEVPMADGGEGTLEAVGGSVRAGPWCRGPRAARSRRRGGCSRGAGAPGPTAVIEMARAAGRDLLAAPVGDEPLRADTAGVGHLVLAAVDAGARRVVVAVGGSATTDGGAGAVGVIGSASALGGAELVVACDVTTPFLDAARVFGPQKGASPVQVDELTARLGALADRYRATWGSTWWAWPAGGPPGGWPGAWPRWGPASFPASTWWPSWSTCRRGSGRPTWS